MAEERKPIELSIKDYEMLLSLDKDIEHARRELERAKRVGIDVSALEKQLEDAVALRNRILEEYKPSSIPSKE